MDYQETTHPATERESARGRVTVTDVRTDPEVTAFVRQANATLGSLGYTEHGERHASLVARVAEDVLVQLGHDRRLGELAQIAGYLHDIGNLLHREHHAQSGALMAWPILKRLGMSSAEIALVMNAIGNHEEERGTATNSISAAVIIADKADVHRSRVQNPNPAAFDIHDRVNYAATRSQVRVDASARSIVLELEIDTQFAQVIEYFEIFLSRMTMVRQAVNFLDCEFRLLINDVYFS